MKNKKEEGFLTQLELYREIFEDFRHVETYLNDQERITFRTLKVVECYVKIINEDIDAFTKKYYSEPVFIDKLKELKLRMLTILDVKCSNSLFISKKFYKKILEISKNLAFMARIQESIIEGYDKKYVGNKRSAFLKNQLNEYLLEIKLSLNTFENSINNLGLEKYDSKALKFIYSNFNILLFILRNESSIDKTIAEKCKILIEQIDDLINNIINKHKTEYTSEFYKFSWIAKFNYYSKELYLVIDEKAV